MNHNEMQVKKGKHTQRILNVSALLIFLAGLISAATGIWFIFGDHPFYHQDGMAEDFGMTEAQVHHFNPELANWAVHVSDQIGSLTTGWALFMMILAWFGIRRGHRFSWIAVLIAGMPTMFYSSLGEWIMFGKLDGGSPLAIVVFILFLCGMLLPIKTIFNGKE